MTSKGCLWTLIIGFVLGAFRLAVDTPIKLVHGFQYEQGSFLWIVSNIYFQYFSLLIFVVCVIVMIVVSYMTAEPSNEQITGLTYQTVNAEHRAESRKSWDKRDVIFSVLVLVAILAAYLYFNG